MVEGLRVGSLLQSLDIGSDRGYLQETPTVPWAVLGNDDTGGPPDNVL